MVIGHVLVLLPITRGTRGLHYTSCWEIPADTHGWFVTVVRRTWPDDGDSQSTDED